MLSAAGAAHPRLVTLSPSGLARLYLTVDSSTALVVAAIGYSLDVGPQATWLTSRERRIA